VRWSSSRPGRPRTAIFFPGELCLCDAEVRMALCD
jgi:hypothetical protein